MVTIAFNLQTQVKITSRLYLLSGRPKSLVVTEPDCEARDRVFDWSYGCYIYLLSFINSFTKKKRTPLIFSPPEIITKRNRFYSFKNVSGLIVKCPHLQKTFFPNSNLRDKTCLQEIYSSLYRTAGIVESSYELINHFYINFHKLSCLMHQQNYSAVCRKLFSILCVPEAECKSFDSSEDLATISRDRFRQ